MYQPHLTGIDDDVRSADAECPSCLGRLQYRGCRGATLIFECPDPGCPAILVEIQNPAASPDRQSERGRTPRQVPTPMTSKSSITSQSASECGGSVRG